MILAELSFESGSMVAAGYLILGGIAVVAYRLGSYTTKVDAIAKQQDDDRKEIKDDLTKIFEKLDLLAQRPPHNCTQGDHFSRLDTKLAGMEVTLMEHKDRMDRIQQAIRDKEQHEG